MIFTLMIPILPAPAFIILTTPIGITFPDALLLLNASATWVMVGVIWFVQRVH